MYGHKIEFGSPNRGSSDVIGEVDVAPAGNIILRVGKTLPKYKNLPGDENTYWEQRLHVVLTPEEVNALVVDLLGKSKVPGWDHAVANLA